MVSGYRDTVKKSAIVSSVLALVFLALTNVPDPKIFGLTSEPSHILFYILTAVLAVVSGLVAVICLLFWVIGRGREHPDETVQARSKLGYRILIGIIVVGAALLLVAILPRLGLG